MQWGNGYGDDNAKSTRAVLFLGFCLGLSFILLIVAGAVFKNWYPMLNVAAVVLIPIAIILADATGSSSVYMGYDETKAAFQNLSSCVFGTILASMFGLPLVLLHAGIVLPPEFGLWIGSTILTFAGAVYYWFARGKKQMW